MVLTDESPDIQYFYNVENMIKIAFPVFRIFRYLYFCSNDFLLSGVRLKRLRKNPGI
jgi:hypothetical protein